jgi:predicted ABC-type ATPase
MEMRFPVDISDIGTYASELSEIIDNALKCSKSNETPTFIHMLGAPGAGKSTYAKLAHSYAKENEKQFTYLGFDKIMQAMPSYQKEKSVIKALDKYELPARRAGYSLLKELIDKKANILFDHGGSFDEHPDILSYSKHKGFKTAVLYIELTEEEAALRVEKRNQEKGRFTPPGYVHDRSKAIKALLPLYIERSDYFIKLTNHQDAHILDEHIGAFYDEIKALF